MEALLNSAPFSSIMAWTHSFRWWMVDWMWFSGMRGCIFSSLPDMRSLMDLNLENLGPFYRSDKFGCNVISNFQWMGNTDERMAFLKQKWEVCFFLTNQLNRIHTWVCSAQLTWVSFKSIWSFNFTVFFLCVCEDLL